MVTLPSFFDNTIVNWIKFLPVHSINIYHNTNSSYDNATPEYHNVINTILMTTIW